MTIAGFIIFHVSRYLESDSTFFFSPKIMPESKPAKPLDICKQNCKTIKIKSTPSKWFKMCKKTHKTRDCCFDKMKIDKDNKLK